MIRTYLLFSFTMIFFRATSVSNAIEIIKSMFVNHHTTMSVIPLTKFGDYLILLVFILSIISLFIMELIQRKENIIEKILKQKIVLRWLIIYILIISIVIFGCYGSGYDPTTFIYRGF